MQTIINKQHIVIKQRSVLLPPKVAMANGKTKMAIIYTWWSFWHYSWPGLIDAWCGHMKPQSAGPAHLMRNHEMQSECPLYVNLIRYRVIWCYLQFERKLIIQTTCQACAIQHTMLSLVPLMATAHSGKVFNWKTGTAMELTVAVSTAIHIMFTTKPVAAWVGEQTTVSLIQ